MEVPKFEGLIIILILPISSWSHRRARTHCEDLVVDCHMSNFCAESEGLNFVSPGEFWAFYERNGKYGSVCGGCRDVSQIFQNMEVKVDELQNTAVRLDTELKAVKKAQQQQDAAAQRDKLFERYRILLADATTKVCELVWDTVSEEDPTAARVIFYDDLKNRRNVERRSRAEAMLENALIKLGISVADYQHLVSMNDARNEIYHCGMRIAEVLEVLKKHQVPPQFSHTKTILISLEAKLLAFDISA